MLKFICAIAGFFFLGRNILGAIIGFAIGSYLDYFNSSNKDSDGSKRNPHDDIFTHYKRQAAMQNNNFASMLIALSAAVLRADGSVIRAELDFVKSFFSQQFGPQFSVSHLQELKYYVNSGNIPLEKICYDIKLRTKLEVRIQLLHYLFGIAKADGNVSNVEIDVIKRIAQLLEVPLSDFESLKNMFYRDVNSDYKVLGIESTATDEEIKKAYRQMAIRYHPDKVATMGEEYQKGAHEKFQKIQEAYENIKKQRGMN